MKVRLIDPAPKDNILMQTAKDIKSYWFARLSLTTVAALTPPEIDLIRIDEQDIAGWSRPEWAVVSAKCCTQLCGVRLQRPARTRRWVVAPQRVDQRIGRDRPVRTEQELDEKEPGFGAAHVDGCAVRVGHCDGTEEAGARLERVLTGDPGTGVMRHADAGYEEAVAFAKEHRIDLPML